MLKVSARVQLRAVRAQSLEIVVLLLCYVSIAMKIIPEHIIALFKLPVKF